MILRVGAAICIAAIMFVYASFFTIAHSANHREGKSNLLASSTGIMGVASMYNPDVRGTPSGGTETASGEQYDPSAWTAAIQIDLREKFGGVHYGKDYRPTFALVARFKKQAIVKINDVGPLEPGRIIDFDEQAMRYFDPTLELGLIQHVMVTPLLGEVWRPGPIADSR
jgi:rare lipoprotein A